MKQDKIKKISILKTKTKIYFESGNSFEINKNIISTLKLYAGKSLTSKEKTKIKSLSKEEDLLLFVSNKLKVVNLTKGKVKEYLKKKGANDTQIKNILERLEKANVLREDEIFYAILEYADYKHFGHNKLIKKLYDSRISESLITKVKYDEKREYKQCRLYIKQIEKKFENKNNFKRKEAIYQSAVRNGFNPSIALELVNKIANSNNNHEINVLKLDYLKVFGKYSKKLKGKELENKITTSLLQKGYKIEDIKYVEDLKKWNGLMN